MQCSHASKAAALILALSALAGCRGPTVGPPNPAAQASVTANAPANSSTAGPTLRAAFPLTVIDDAGRRITLPRPPARIVSLAPSNTEILYALGLGDRVAAVDQQSNYPPEVARKRHIAGYLAPDQEPVIAARPDLALAVGYHLDRAVAQLDAAHINTLVLEPHNLEGMLHDLLLVGQATGRSDRAAELVKSLRARIDAVAARVRGARRPTVYYELDTQLYTVGPGSFIDDLLTRAGGDNIAADADRPWPKISAEKILLRNVDVILLSDMAAGVTAESVARRPGWQNLRAVQRRRIVGISPDQASRPGPRVVDALEAIARALHPDRFTP
jgi:iron complex transport system substrate-binding protein